jgi:hypothetical protein
MIVGESDGIRTHGHRGHNPVLYQLSYALHMRSYPIGTSGRCQAIEHFPEIPRRPWYDALDNAAFHTDTVSHQGLFPRRGSLRPLFSADSTTGRSFEIRSRMGPATFGFGLNLRALS